MEINGYWGAVTRQVFSVLYPHGICASSQRETRSARHSHAKLMLDRKS